MADWYVSSANFAAVSAWAATTAYTVGQFVKRTAPTHVNSHVYRCTIAGTSGATEPTWAASPANNDTIISGTVTFTNVTGQSAYGWSAAAGTLYSIASGGGAGPNRNLVGDRVFLASDHSETITSGAVSYTTNDATNAFGLVQFISVNRAGSVPPAAADAQSGASITANSGTNVLALEAFCDAYWQGISFTQAASSSIYFNSGATKAHYLKNCGLFLNTTGATRALTAGNPSKVTFDNTTVRFGHASQTIGGVSGYSLDLTWLNTPAALLGAIFPTFLFTVGSTAAIGMTICRGVDLSAVTGTLVGNSSGFSKVLLDSCKIAPNVTRLAPPTISSGFNDELELVNCFDGTNVLNEHYTPVGAVTTDRSVTMNGGAQDDVSVYSLKLASSIRADKAVLTLDNFWLDVENTAIGTAKTATVEIISFASLNNNDISLLLEYMGTAGSSIASFVSSLPAVLTAPAALPVSSATWTSLGAMGLDPTTTVNAALSNGNLTATHSTVATNSGARCAISFTAGKYYFEWKIVAQNSADALGLITPVALYSGLTAYVAINGNMNVFGSFIGNIGGFTTNDFAGIAVDFTAGLLWFRRNAGTWNGSGTANPATGTGGIAFTAGTAMMPGLLFGVSGVGGEVYTVNFGATAYGNPAPAGFGVWGTATKQKLQVPFTPQVVGRVRGLVRLGKPSTTAWVNPQIAIT